MEQESVTALQERATGRLADKVVLVTGASTGIGRAVAMRFAQEGAKVVGAARSEDRLRDCEETIRSNGGEFAYAVGDLGTEEGAADVFAKLKEIHGATIDVLVNNAGVGYSLKALMPASMDPVHTTPPEDWDFVFSVNVGSMVRCTRHAIPLMQSGGGGSIVTVCSILGHTGHTDAHAYTATKGAILNLSRSIAVAYAADGIRSNTVSPGFIETPMAEDVIDVMNSEDFRFQWNPMGRMGKAEEIANACLFFASDESSYCNGSDLMVDGGTAAKCL